MDTIYSLQNALRELAPDFKWSGLGNLLGDYGEFIAIEYYDLTKASAGSDAINSKGKTVQVKTCHASSQIGYRGEADLMLVLYVGENGKWEEKYYGDFNKIKKHSNYSARDNKNTITLTKIKRIVNGEI
tara:strand:+ start:5833 stop:6219 length:387 start_codon:yes stop_codon:yes gene_type:complete